MCDKSRDTWLCVHWQWNTLEWCQLNALQASPVVHLVTPLSCVPLSMNTQLSVPTIEWCCREAMGATRQVVVHWYQLIAKRCGSDFKGILFNLIIRSCTFGTRSEIALRWLTHNAINEKPKMVQFWGRQATSLIVRFMGQPGAHLGPTEPKGVHVGPMNFAIWDEFTWVNVDPDVHGNMALLSHNELRRSDAYKI